MTARAAGALGVLQLAAALLPPWGTPIWAVGIGKAAASRSTPRGFAGRYIQVVQGNCAVESGQGIEE